MIKIGDTVYYKYRIGFFYRTLSGIVLKIKNNIVTLKITNQNSYGKIIQINVNNLNLKK
jgi:hypothetical protein